MSAGENQVLIDLGIRQGYSNALHAMMDHGVSLEVQDVVQELLDRAYLRAGYSFEQREPRSKAVKAERDALRSLSASKEGGEGT